VSKIIANKLILWVVFLVVILFLSYVFLMVAVAVYSEIVVPTTTRGRPQIEKEFFVKDSELGWRLKKNLSVYLIDPDGKNKKLYFSTNELGFRNTSAIMPSQQHGRLLLLGDSHAQGYFLYDTETIGYLLSQSQNSFVFNAGVGGYSTDQQFTLMSRLTEHHNFDWIVLLFCLNDLMYLDKDKAWGLPKPYYGRNEMGLNFDDFYPLKSAPSLPYALHQIKNDSLGKEDEDQLTLTRNYTRRSLISNIKSKFGALFEKSFYPKALFLELTSLVGENMYSRFDLGYHKDYLSLPATSTPSRYNWNLAFQFFQEMNQIAHRQGGQFAVLFLPEMVQILDKKKIDKLTDANGDVFTEGDLGQTETVDVGFKVQEYFMLLCKEKKIKCIEPSAKFLEEHRRKDLYFMDDGHLSPAGNRLAAEIISKSIRGL